MGKKFDRQVEKWTAQLREAEVNRDAERFYRLTIKLGLPTDEQCPLPELLERGRLITGLRNGSIKVPRVLDKPLFYYNPQDYLVPPRGHSKSSFGPELNGADLEMRYFAGKIRVLHEADPRLVSRVSVGRGSSKSGRYDTSYDFRVHVEKVRRDSTLKPLGVEYQTNFFSHPHGEGSLDEAVRDSSYAVRDMVGLHLRHQGLFVVSNTDPSLMVSRSSE